MMAFRRTSAGAPASPWVVDVAECRRATPPVLWAGLSTLTVATGPICRVGGSIRTGLYPNSRASSFKLQSVEQQHGLQSAAFYGFFKVEVAH